MGMVVGGGEGVGWAAAGILRVWTIIQRSQYADQFKRESDELVSWAKEIMDDVIKYQVSLSSLHREM